MAKNQHSELFGALSKCLETVEVTKIIAALTGLLEPGDRPASKRRKPTKKQIADHFSAMVKNNIRGHKPAFLK